MKVVIRLTNAERSAATSPIGFEASLDIAAKGRAAVKLATKGRVVPRKLLKLFRQFPTLSFNCRKACGIKSRCTNTLTPKKERAVTIESSCVPGDKLFHQAVLISAGLIRAGSQKAFIALG